MATLILSIFFYYFPLSLSIYVLTKHFLIHKLKNLPPTPFPPLPIIGHLHLLKQPLHLTLSKLSHKLGPIVYLQLGSRPFVVVSSPSLAEECLSKNDAVLADRPRLLLGKHLGHDYTYLAQAPYGDHLKRLRRILSSELLSSGRVQMLSEIRLNEVKLLARNLFRDQTNEVDMKATFFGLSLNIMMMKVAGKRFYMGESVLDMEDARRYRKILEEMVALNSTPNVGDFLPWIGPNNKLMKRLVELERERDDFMQGLIDEHRKDHVGDDEEDGDESVQGKKKTTTFIGAMLEKQRQDPENYTDDVIKGLVLVILAAGTETTSSTMEWALSLIVNHPNVLTKARAEIDNSIGHDRLIDDSDLPNLPYLRCVITETMRLYPVIPTLLPHASSQDCVVGGYHVPRGTMLFVNVRQIHSDPRVWADPQKFDPERFNGMEGTKDGMCRMLPFGYGRRSCPGDVMAQRVMGLTLGLLIQCFEWETVGREEKVDMAEGAGITLPRDQPLMLKFRPRQEMLKILSQM